MELDPFYCLSCTGCDLLLTFGLLRLFSGEGCMQYFSTRLAPVVLILFLKSAYGKKLNDRFDF